MKHLSFCVWNIEDFEISHQQITYLKFKCRQSNYFFKVSNKGHWKTISRRHTKTFTYDYNMFSLFINYFYF